MTNFIYSLASPHLLGLLCYVIVAAYAYRFAINGNGRRLAYLVRAFNWFLLGSVYLFDALTGLPPESVRIYYRVALGLMIFGEFAFHVDTLADLRLALARLLASCLRGTQASKQRLLCLLRRRKA